MRAHTPEIYDKNEDRCWNPIVFAICKRRKEGKYKLKVENTSVFLQERGIEYIESLEKSTLQRRNRGSKMAARQVTAGNLKRFERSGVGSRRKGRKARDEGDERETEMRKGISREREKEIHEGRGK